MKISSITFLSAFLCTLFILGRCEDHIEVFIVSHSHDDVGWIMPWERYYTTEVKSIIDTTTEALFQNPNRKYTQVEVQFLRYWWNEANETMREKYKTVLGRGQLEFNNGGTTMNDEACTTYNQAINQMTNGHRWLQDTFGVLPGASWHVDPFGHSSVTPSLWALIGFPGYGIARIPGIVRANMTKNQGFEFVWRGSSSLGRYTEMWTHVLNPNYYPPAEMSFDDIATRPMDKIAADCARVIRQVQKNYRHNLRMIPWGGDFSHQDGIKDFTLMDQLIATVNGNPQFNMTFRYAFYSDYIRSVNDLNLEWDVYQDDFFPYVEDPHTTWTGYFSSRSLFKNFVRKCDALLAAAEHILALQGDSSNKNLNEDIEVLRQATSVATHHDAITGTETVETNEDYIKNLGEGVNKANQAVTQMLHAVLKSNHSGNHYAVHNPLGWRRSEFVSMVISSPNAVVKDHNNKRVISQVNPVPIFSKTDAKYRLYFWVDIGPLSTATYTVQFLPSRPKDVKVHKSFKTVSNSRSTFQFDKNGRLNKAYVYDDQGGRKSIDITMEIAQYRSTTSWSPADGAYIFRPDRPMDYAGNITTSPPSVEILTNNNIKTVVVEGPYITEVQQLHAQDNGLTFIEYKRVNTTPYTEIIHEIGPLPKQGVDVIVRFNTSLNNDRVIYTDNNGLEIMKRRYNNDVVEPESANYYPMTQRAFIRDEQKDLQLTLMTDNGHGTASLYNGQIELMLHRRLAADDGKGVEEVLDDTTAIRFSVRLVLSSAQESTMIHRRGAFFQNFPPQIFPVHARGVVDGLGELPPNIHLLTVRTFREKVLLVRLQHIYSAGEHPTLAVPGTIDLPKYLSPKVKFSEISETNLVGTVAIEKMNKMKWKTSAQSPGADFRPIPIENGILHIQPGEIRTFLVKLL